MRARSKPRTRKLRSPAASSSLKAPRAKPSPPRGWGGPSGADARPLSLLVSAECLKLSIPWQDLVQWESPPMYQKLKHSRARSSDKHMRMRAHSTSFRRQSPSSMVQSNWFFTMRPIASFGLSIKRGSIRNQVIRKFWTACGQLAFCPSRRISAPGKKACLPLINRSIPKSKSGFCLMGGPCGPS